MRLHQVRTGRGYRKADEDGCEVTFVPAIGDAQIASATGAGYCSIVISRSNRPSRVNCIDVGPSLADMHLSLLRGHLVVLVDITATTLVSIHRTGRHDGPLTSPPTGN